MLWLLWQLLERRDRLRFGMSLFFIFIGTILEMLSLALVIPVVGVILGDKRQSYDWLPDSIEDMRYQTFTVLLLSLLVLAFLMKNLFMIASGYYQTRSQLSLGNRTTQRLFETYMSQPYEFHLTHSSAVLLRNIGEYAGAVQFFLGPALILLSDILTGIGFLTILLIVQPGSTLLVGFVFGGASWLVLRVTRRRVRAWGEERVKYRASINEALIAGFGGVKEIKLFGRDDQVLNSHRNSVYAVSRTVYLFNVIQSLPRALFEVLAVVSVALAIIVSKLGNQNSDDATLIIALFGVVAFRMLPSINRIVLALQQMSLTRAGLTGAVEDLALGRGTREDSSRGLPVTFNRLEISNLKYRYPNVAEHVIDVEQLRIDKSEAIGVVGTSGSGKSTFVDLIIGILQPESGDITVNGKTIYGSRRQWQDQIGYVPQHVYLMNTTIRRNVAFGLPEKHIDNGQVERALRQANLLDFVQSLPQGWETEVGERGVRLSGGQRQRLGIARALYGSPQVIVLDEATSALDEFSEREIVESFREIAKDHTLIVVAHRTSTLRYCSRLIRLEGGRIVQEGSFEEVIGSMKGLTNRGQ